MRQVSDRITLRDVARHAGISVNAASKVLNNTRSGAHVSGETRGRIIEAAKLLGYQPNSAAQSLVRRRSNIIGLYFDDPLDATSPFNAELIGGAEKGCSVRKQSLLLYGRRPEQTTDDICRDLLSGVVDGVVIAAWSKPDLIDRLRDSHLGVVHYPFAHPQLPSVLIDEDSATRQAAEYLRDKGHRRIVYRGFPQPEIDDHRLLRYERAGMNAGLEVSVMRAVNGEGHLSDSERELLARPRDARPTAVVCWNDEFAYHLLDYCDDIGLRVPEDLAVVGFDGAHTFPHPRRRLTTVIVPWGDVARTAVCLLVDIRDGIIVPDETLLPVQLGIGHTV